MTLNFGTDEPVVGLARQRKLVQAVLEASSADETRWLEWKSHHDVSKAAGALLSPRPFSASRTGCLTWQSNGPEAMHHPDNPASGRVLAKAGFTRIGTADRDTETGTVPYELYALESGA